MSQTHGWQPDREGDEGGLWLLALEYEDSPQARRERLEEKRRLLIEAGVLLPTDGEPEAMSLQGGRRCHPPYHRGTSTTGGRTGKA